MKHTIRIALFLGLTLSLVTLTHAQGLPNPLGSGVSTIGDLLTVFVNGLVMFSTPIVILAIMYAGYLLLSAQGDPEMLTQARRTIFYALAGYAIILLANGMVIIIRDFFS
jgi:hypothetical protein